MLYSLPSEILSLIFSFDDTFKQVYNEKVVKLLNQINKNKNKYNKVIEIINKFPKFNKLFNGKCYFFMIYNFWETSLEDRFYVKYEPNYKYCLKIAIKGNLNEKKIFLQFNKKNI